MLNEEQLRERLRSSETHWVERKKSFHNSEIKEAIVAFANSVPENQHAVLFIGAAPDGSHPGIPNADEAQRKVNSIAGECFPPIRCTPAVVREGDKEIVAVVVEFTNERPHFAGAPFIRVGSETIKDKQKLRVVLEDLISSRNEKARRILREKGQIVSVVLIEPPPKVRGNSNSFIGQVISQMGSQRYEKECRLESCDAFVLRCVDIHSKAIITAPLGRVTICHDVQHDRLELEIDET